MVRVSEKNSAASEAQQIAPQDRREELCQRKKVNAEQAPARKGQPRATQPGRRRREKEGKRRFTAAQRVEGHAQEKRGELST